jgi:hypothetical protein
MADFAAVDLAYAAGIIDGEGSIGITELAPGRQRRRSPQFRPYVAVCMTDPVVPLLLADMFGGTVHTYAGRKPGQKASHHWRLGAQRAAAACEALVPYLRVKHEQAALVVAFYRDSRFQFKQRRALPDREITARREYVAKCRALNARGDQGGQ